MTGIQKYLRTGLRCVRSLSEGRESLLSLLREFTRQSGGSRLAFVSGILTSDGPGLASFHRRELLRYTGMLHRQLGIAIFCCQDVFSEDQEIFFTKNGTRYRDWLVFWRSVLASGYVTDIYFIPGWHRSEGARDEYRAALRNGLRIYEIEPVFPISRPLIIHPK